MSRWMFPQAKKKNSHSPAWLHGNKRHLKLSLQGANVISSLQVEDAINNVLDKIFM